MSVLTTFNSICLVVSPRDERTIAPDHMKMLKCRASEFLFERQKLLSNVFIALLVIVFQ